ncbi:MAG: O-antigen ligase family protein [Nibricoccus sp.]
MARPKFVSSAAIGEWLVAILLAANLAWTILCLGGYRPETMALSWPLTAAALGTQLGFAAWRGERPHPAGFFLLPFLGYAAFNVAAVSPVPWLGWRDWFGWAQVIAVFWIYLNGLKRSGPRILVLATVVVLGAISVLLAAYQRFVSPDWLMLGRTQAQQFWSRASGPFGIPNSLAAFLLLLIPPMLALMWQRGSSSAERVFWGYFAAVFLFGLGLTISRGAWLSLALALIVWPFCKRSLSLQMRFLLASTALAGAVLVGMILYASVPQIKTRIDSMVADAGERSRPILWQASVDLFLDAPVLGTGGGSFNTLFERYRPMGFRDEPQWAHNDYLNTLSDYGAVGFVLFFGGAAMVGLKAIRSRKAQPSIETASLAGWSASGVTTALGIGLAAFALSLFVDFHLKIPGLAMAVAICAGELVRRTWVVTETLNRTIALRGGMLLGGLAVILFALGVVVPVYRAEAARYAGRESVDRFAANPNPPLNEYREVLTSAALRFSEAVRLHPGNGQAWADRSYVNSLSGHLAPGQLVELGRESEAYARKALERSTDVAEFWIRLGVSLDMQGRWDEANPAFYRAVELGKMNSINWYYLAYHQSLSIKGKREVNNSIVNCLRLDPANRLALALRQRTSSN